MSDLGVFTTNTTSNFSPVLEESGILGHSNSLFVPPPAYPQFGESFNYPQEQNVSSGTTMTGFGLEDAAAAVVGFRHSNTNGNGLFIYSFGSIIWKRAKYGVSKFTLILPTTLH